MFTSSTTVLPRAFTTLWQQRSIFPVIILAENLSSYSYHFNNIRSTPAYPLLGLHLLCIPRCSRLPHSRAPASHLIVYPNAVSTIRCWCFDTYRLTATVPNHTLCGQAYQTSTLVHRRYAFAFLFGETAVLRARMIWS
jgi:hypothetical protein